MRIILLAAAAALLATGCGERNVEAPEKTDTPQLPASQTVAASPSDGMNALSVKAAMDKCYGNQDAQAQDACVRSLEDSQFALADGRVSRDDLSLCFKTGAPAPVCLEDQPALGMDSERDYTQYLYLGRLPGPRLYVVERSRYQGSDVMLIDADTGKVSEVGAIPVASPDGNRIAVASTQLDPSADDADQVIYRLASALTIYRHGDGKLQQEFELKAPDDWGPGEPRWLTPERVEVPVMRIIDASDHAVLQATGTKTYEWLDGRWREAATSAKPAAAN